MKLVQFDDGSYGVRSHWFFGWYFHTINPEYFWLTEGFVKNGDWLFHHCKGTKEAALETIDRLRPRKPKKWGYRVIL